MHESQKPPGIPKKLIMLGNIAVLIFVIASCVLALHFVTSSHLLEKPTPTPRPTATPRPTSTPRPTPTPTPTVVYQPACSVRGRHVFNMADVSFLNFRTYNSDNPDKTIVSGSASKNNSQIKGKYIEVNLSATAWYRGDGVGCIHLLASWKGVKPVLVAYQDITQQEKGGNPIRSFNPKLTIDLDRPLITGSSGDPNPAIPINIPVTLTFEMSDSRYGYTYNSSDLPAFGSIHTFTFVRVLV